MVDDRPVRDTHRAAVVRPPDRPVTQRSMRCLGEDTGILFSRSNDGAPSTPSPHPTVLRPSLLSVAVKLDCGAAAFGLRGLVPCRRLDGTVARTN